jgi:hypothetical protein
VSVYQADLQSPRFQDLTSQFATPVTIKIDRIGMTKAFYPNGSTTDDFACLLDGGKVTFAPSVGGDPFVAIFDQNHPFHYDHRVHVLGLYDTNELIDAKGDGGTFKYAACYVHDIVPKCQDPKIIVKAVPAFLLSLSSALTSLTVSFPDQQRGTPSDPISVTVQNGWGSPVTIGEVRKASAGSDKGDVAAFNFSTNCDRSPLAVGGSCTITVTFAPTKGGSQTQTAAIVVPYQATEPNQTQTRIVSGKGL